jgi:hypothetical protein
MAWARTQMSRQRVRIHRALGETNKALNPGMRIPQGEASRGFKYQ